MTKRVLIATLFHSDAVMLSVTKLGPDRSILLINKEPTKEQEKSIKTLEGALGKVIEIKKVKVDVYDIVSISEKAVEIIDMQPDEDEIFVNLTSGRKTQSMGLLFAAYARHNRVKKIAYYPEDSKEIVYLPRISFKLTSSQKKILEYLHNNKDGKSIKELADKIEISTAMLYRAIDELKGMDLVSTEEGVKLTDAGKIARL
ncbi:MAG: CRISPR-associated CARF protein Csa3 [bacterium]